MTLDISRQILVALQFAAQNRANKIFDRDLGKRVPD